MNKIYSGILSFIFVFVAFAAFTTDANAACSYGYRNANGVCTVSYVNTYSYANQNTQVDSLEAYVQQLIALIEQLRALQNGQANSNNPVSNGNSRVDVETVGSKNVDDEDATLRGEIDFNNEDEATVYFQYGRSSSDLSNDTTHYVLDEDDDDEDFEHTITNLRDDTRYYYRAVAEDERGRKVYGKIRNFTSDDNSNSGSNNDDEPELDVDDADEVTDDSAELNGSVDMNDFRNGIVFFIYGEDKDLIEDVEDDFDEYVDVDEEGDDLQKVRVDTDLDGDDDYSYDAKNLSEDEKIYFSICVEYEDEDDDEVLKCSSVESFETDGNNRSNNDDEPEIETENASGITDDSARINGSVDMNDFENGLVFFVYGEDEDQIDDVAGDYDQYSDVDEDGDDLQKIKISSNVDDDADFYASISGLDDDTEIFYAACVEYEDDDDDDVILCGDTEDFTTRD